VQRKTSDGTKEENTRTTTKLRELLLFKISQQAGSLVQEIPEMDCNITACPLVRRTSG
jgi:hypothetical protein